MRWPRHFERGHDRLDPIIELVTQCRVGVVVDGKVGSVVAVDSRDCTTEHAQVESSVFVLGESVQIFSAVVSA